MRDFMDRRVTHLVGFTSPIWGPPPPCKQTLSDGVRKVWSVFTRLTCSYANGPFTSSRNSHFQSEAKYNTFLVKINFICLRINSHFHIKG